MQKRKKYNKLTRKKEGGKVLTAKRPVDTVETRAELKIPETKRVTKTSKSRALLKSFGNRYKGIDLVDYSRRLQ